MRASTAWNSHSASVFWQLQGCDNYVHLAAASFSRIPFSMHLGPGTDEVIQTFGFGVHDDDSNDPNVKKPRSATAFRGRRTKGSHGWLPSSLCLGSPSPVDRNPPPYQDRSVSRVHGAHTIRYPPRRQTIRVLFLEAIGLPRNVRVALSDLMEEREGVANSHSGPKVSNQCCRRTLRSGSE